MGSKLSDPIPIKRCSRQDLGIDYSGTLTDDTIVYENKEVNVNGRTWQNLKLIASSP